MNTKVYFIKKRQKNNGYGHEVKFKSIPPTD